MATVWRELTKRQSRPTFIWSRAMPLRQAWANPGFHRSLRRFAARSSPRPVSAFASCRSAGNWLDRTSGLRPLHDRFDDSGFASEPERKTVAHFLGACALGRPVGHVDATGFHQIEHAMVLGR